jgi:hypothetical protein
MENKDEEISDRKIRNEDILTKKELINLLDMTSYRERIDNIIGRNYSFLYFDFFDGIYHSKIKNKISAPLSDFLNKANRKEDSFWMCIYKSIKYYSNRENLPILIIKYFHLKAEIEFKFIFNESKKYTNNPNIFIDAYIRKMKKISHKKLQESKSKNLTINMFTPQIKRSFIMRSFLSKKSVIRPKKSNNKINLCLNNIDEDDSDTSTKEDDIKNKKQMRTQIMKQIHQLKVNTIKEIEKANNIQSKQKKKYGKIKSRFLDVFNKQPKFMNIGNFQLNNKFKYNNIYRHFILNKNKNKEEDEYFPSSQRIKSSINNSKLSYLYSKDFNYSKKNSKFFSDEKSLSNTNYYNNYTNTNYSNRKNTNSFRNSFGNNSNRMKLSGFSTKNSYNNKTKISLFNLELNYRSNAINDYKLFSNKKKNKNNISRIKLIENQENRKSNRKRPKSGLIRKKIDVKSIVNRLEKKKNQELLEYLLYRNNVVKSDYTSKIYELFKKTECF